MMIPANPASSTALKPVRDLGGAVALLLLLVLAAQARAPAQNAPHAVLDSNVRCLLGGSDNGKWLDDETVAAKLSGGEVYRLLRRDGPAGESTGAKAESAGGACEGTFTVPLEPAPDPGRPTIAIGGSWNPSPRPVQDILASKGRYRVLFQPLLAAKGIRAPAEIRQLYRVDLDGDGKDEVVGVLRNFAYEDAAAKPGAGSYSAVAVRKLSGKRVDTIPVEIEKGVREGGISEHSVPLILDLNGDGTLELIVYGRYLQGVFTTVYTLEDGKFRRVLACSCGG